MNVETRIARNEIVRVGRATWELGLNSLKSGNISILLSENDILISKTGRSLKELNPDGDLTVVKGFDTDRGEASCEFYVHRGVYRGANDGRRGAILHCHPPNTIAAAWICNDEIPPAYNEAKDVLGQTSVVESGDREKLGEDPDLIAQPLSQAKIVAVRGHGTFALAETLEECLYLTHLLEISCQVLFLKARAADINSFLAADERRRGATGKSLTGNARF
jgi:L-fuculose-phosphate aldolase